MRIASIIWLTDVVDKLIVKHNVEVYEVEEVFSNRPGFRFVEKGKRPGEDVYLAWISSRGLILSPLTQIWPIG